MKSEITAKKIAKMSPKEQFEKRIGEFETNEEDKQLSVPRWCERELLQYKIGSFREIGKLIEPEMLENVRLVMARPFPNLSCRIPLIGVTESEMEMLDIFHKSENLQEAYLTYSFHVVKNPTALSKIPNVLMSSYQNHVIRDAEEFPIFFHYLPAYDSGEIYIKPGEILKSKRMLDFFTHLLQKVPEVSDDFEPYIMQEWVSDEELDEIYWEYKCINVGEKAYKLGLKQGKKI